MKLLVYLFLCLTHASILTVDNSENYNFIYKFNNNTTHTSKKQNVLLTKKGFHCII